MHGIYKPTSELSGKFIASKVDTFHTICAQPHASKLHFDMRIVWNTIL